MVTNLGGAALLFFSTIRSFHHIPRSFRLTIEQMRVTGIQSLPIVILVSVFIGMVAAYFAHLQTKDFVPIVYVGLGVGKAVMVELGPILTGLVLVGRVGAAMAAELGTMRVTEQIDALETMAINPVRYLVLPRFIAGIVMLPVLVILAEIISIVAGMLLGRISLDIPMHTFMVGLRLQFVPRELFVGIIKAFFFGGIIAIMGCYYGFNAEGGAEGVGRATTRAVVSASVLVLVFDYIIARAVLG
jgi:phospholipid/cholesterol/gamma-HCH transport system permease protein